MSKTIRPIRVLVVDDHQLIRMGLIRMLADHPQIQVIGEAANGEQAFDLAKKENPDVILMDLKMPEVDGLTATRKIRRLLPQTQIIVITVYDEDPLPSRLFQVGAMGYLTKGAPFEELLSAIQIVHEGGRYIDPTLAQNLALQSSQDKNASPFHKLSDRELEIAMAILEGKRATDISQALFLSPKTVSTYRHRLFEKLNIDSDAELTLLAVRYGLIDPQNLS